MKKKISIVLVWAIIIGLIPGVTKAKLVACVGDSVTHGYGLPTSNSYPAQLARILQSFDSEWETQNFGVDGATLLRNTNKPYVAQNAYHSALASEPDVVVIQLGGNDTARATISQIEQNFIPDYLALIDAFAQLPSQPRIFVCNPPPIFGGNYGSNTTLRDVIIPLIQQLPTYRAVEVIDMYTPMEELGHLFPDYLHPNAEGAEMLAEIVASMILGFRFSPDFNGDFKIDIEDLIILIEFWGTDDPMCDIAPPPFGDCIVDVQDLEVVMQYWGREINDPTLVALWALDEVEGSVAYDSLGRNHGTLYGEPLWQPEGGMIDGALQFDGIDDYFSTDFVLNPAAGPFSVFAWVQGGAPGQIIISQTGAADWLSSDPSEGRLMTDLKLKGVPNILGQSLVSPAVITDGEWHRVGLIWDHSKRKLYVDDVEVAANNQTVVTGSGAGLYIGAEKDLESESFWSGLIDDVRIYDRAITP